MRVLYLSYDGLSDPLGQSQILPYLLELSRKGVFYTLITFEKEEYYSLLKDSLEKQTKEAGINWIPLTYTKRPPVFSTLWDLRKMKSKAEEVFKSQKIALIHCRSYLAAIIGLKLKKKSKTKVLFDMRGFWPEERVEGKIWNLKNPLYKIIYSYFKTTEIHLLKESDQITTLSEKAKEIINSKAELSDHKLSITVIPCCADEKIFDPDRVYITLKERFQTQLNIHEKDFVITYLGAIGTWYMLDEMLDFFKRLLQLDSNARFLFITPENPENIQELAKTKSIDQNRVSIIKANRNEVATLLSLSDIGIYFIRPSYSKQASSPTKLAEMLFMGLPVICNSGIGDCDSIIERTDGILVDDFNEREYTEAISKIPQALSVNPKLREEIARQEFSLIKGVEKYFEVYQKTQE